MKKIIKGFTLVELVVTILIVIVLMSISAPIYNVNSTKVKLAEGYALLATIRSAQEQYYAEYGNFYSAGYSVITCYDPFLNINARTNKYFTAFQVGGSGKDYTNGSVRFANVGEKYSFLAGAYSKELGPLQLSYNITVGTTVTRTPIS
ncbi:MAG: prepilin-type N-terminal cleavage/methylation domain-containing protein [Elusimicrobia bacterium]|nr:prepilin-type N-terminal cleavage/methylation domain-containing protein [Elusimicrobiota bacterium]